MPSLWWYVNGTVVYPWVRETVSADHLSDRIRTGSLHLRHFPHLAFVSSSVPLICLLSGMVTHEHRTALVYCQPLEFPHVQENLLSI